MKTLLAFIVTMGLVLDSDARLKQSWNYQTLKEKATLVVLATPTNVTETAEVSALPNIGSVYPDGSRKPVMGKGVETTFEVLIVLKGEEGSKTLVLHHFKLANPDEKMFGGPGLVSFEPKDKKRYLMFLEKEADGRYVAVSGQTDPSDSIKQMVENYP
jgi:hypothetical protein